MVKPNLTRKGTPDGFKRKGINEICVDGISITLGSPWQHIWTYCGAQKDDAPCPCASSPGNKPPTFAKSNYYCEGGTNVSSVGTSFYLSDPLWDGQGCSSNSGCCAELGMPWFYRRTPVPLREDIEVRICKDEVYINEDTAIEEMDIFVL